MRVASCAIAVFVLLTGCGYVGDPLPPALHIPAAITDLTAVQRADRIEIQFTAPAKTTEDLAIREFRALDVRVGPAPVDANLDTWASFAKPVAAPVPEPGTPVNIAVPASEWAGREVIVAARLVSTRGRESDWSNVVTLRAKAALPVPAIKAEMHPEGIRLSWAAGNARIFRGEDAIGTSTGPEFVDRAVEAGKTYVYRAQAVENGAESALSDAISVVFEDKFAPKTPSGVIVVAGLDSVELTWEPATETDVAKYRILRATGSGEFAAIGEAAEGPAYSDRTASAPGTYRYRVTAVDRTGNESQPSDPVEVSR